MKIPEYESPNTDLTNVSRYRKTGWIGTWGWIGTIRFCVFFSIFSFFHLRPYSPPCPYSPRFTVPSISDNIFPDVIAPIEILRMWNPLLDTNPPNVSISNNVFPNSIARLTTCLNVNYPNTVNPNLQPKNIDFLKCCCTKNWVSHKITLFSLLGCFA